MEIICMKCQIMFSLKHKENITNCSSAELAQIMVKVKARIKTNLQQQTFRLCFSPDVGGDVLLKWQSSACPSVCMCVYQFLLNLLSDFLWNFRDFLTKTWRSAYRFGFITFDELWPFLCRRICICKACVRNSSYTFRRMFYDILQGFLLWHKGVHVLLDFRSGHF